MPSMLELLGLSQPDPLARLQHIGNYRADGTDPLNQMQPIPNNMLSQMGTMPPQAPTTPWLSQPGNNELLLGLGAGLLNASRPGGGGLAAGLGQGALQGMGLHNQAVRNVQQQQMMQQQAEYQKAHEAYFQAEADRANAAQAQEADQRARMAQAAAQLRPTLSPEEQKQFDFDPNGFMKQRFAAMDPSNRYKTVGAGLFDVTGPTPHMVAEGPPNQRTNVTVMPPGVNIDMGGKPQYEAVQKYYGDTFSKMQDVGISAQSRIAHLQQLGHLLEGVQTGKYTPAATEFKAGLKSLGIDPSAIGLTDNVGQAQAAQALSNEMALTLRNPAGGAGMPGALSDADRTFLQSMVPGLATTPEGRKMMTDFQSRMAKRDQDVAKMAREYVQRPGKGYLDSGFFDELQKFSDEHPLAPQTASPEEATKLTPGTVFMTTDGRVMVR